MSSSLPNNSANSNQIRLVRRPRLRPARIEEVVDGVKLRAQLTAAALDAIGDEAGARDRARQLLHGALFRGRMIAKERLESGENGYQTARLLAQVADEVLGALFDFATVHMFRARNPTEGERFAVLAVGGYGRGELAPSSDIDLLFLRAYKQTPWSESVTEFMLYMLWDMGLKVGHSSRTVDECLKLARDDHTIETALLEARRIAGDPALVDDFKTRFREEVTQGRHAAFIAAKLEERDRRHARAGASRYLVEPNVKEGKGGLRDLHTLFWMARHRYGYETPGDYTRAGVFDRETAIRFRKALTFLWTVRCHLHFLTGRAEERLSFDVQPEMAARLGYGARGGQQAVERFMKRYFLVVKEVGFLTRALCATLEADEAKTAPLGLKRLLPARRATPLETKGFTARAGRLEVAQPAVLDEPLNLLRLFHLADVHSLDVHPSVLRDVTQRLRQITAAVRAQPEASKLFLEVAASRRNPGAALRLMNETGVLGRFVPEFGRIVAQMQFNMYHHYTVDEHTLRAVEIISDIEHNRCRDDHPLATSIFPRIVNRRALYLAMLLHDTGKGIGDQQEEGEKSARAACERLGLAAEEVDLVAWLVRHHLMMSDVAQKRDISDPRTVAQFAQAVGTLERLRLLLVLTVADIRAVGPGIWNGWKGQLLRDLYRLTEAAFRGGRTDESAVQERLQSQAQDMREAMTAALPQATVRRLSEWLEGMETGYWLSFDEGALAWHASEADRALRQHDKAHVAVRPRPEHGVTEIMVIAPDRRGLFGSLAAACASVGADIADARAEGVPGGRALSVFSVQNERGGPFAADDPAVRAALAARLEKAALHGHAPPPRRAASRRHAAFAIAPWVKFENDIAQSATVIEVSGRDRPGLLAELSTAMAEAGVMIASAHIGAYGERVADVFYVTDEHGEKITSGRRLALLRAQLLFVLREGDPAAPADPAKQPMAVAQASEAR